MSGSGTGSGTATGSAIPTKPPEPLELAPLEADPDGLFTVEMPLGREPALPPAFGALRPWIHSDELVAARPKEWGDLHWRKKGNVESGGIRWGYTRISEEKYHRVTYQLSFTFVADKVICVILLFHSDDKTRAQELRDRVTVAAKRADGSAHETKVAGWAEVGDVSIAISVK